MPDNMLSKVQESARRMLEFLGPLVSCLVIDEEVGRVLVSFFQKLTGNKALVWWKEFKKFCRGETCWPVGNFYLSCLESASGFLGATTGEGVFAEAVQFFRGYLDPNFAKWAKGVKSHQTEKTPFKVYELIKDGTFMQILNGFGGDISQWFWTEAQALKFVEDHQDKLHPKDWVTFIPYSIKFDEGTKDEHVEFFVAGVRRDVGLLEAVVSLLSDDFVWSAERLYRFVLPQQKPLAT